VAIYARPVGHDRRDPSITKYGIEGAGDVLRVPWKTGKDFCFFPELPRISYYKGLVDEYIYRGRERQRISVLTTKYMRAKPVSSGFFIYVRFIAQWEVKNKMINKVMDLIYGMVMLLVGIIVLLNVGPQLLGMTVTNAATGYISNTTRPVY